MTRITSLEEIQGGRFLIYKHSNRCLISTRAERTLASIAETIEIPIYKVIVHEDRELSQAIAKKFGVAHQSPQAILVADGAVAWHASHDGITAAAVSAAAAGL